ncbi:MAG TPA: succinylglutamate desuccinylase/aspartoacylase family protein [Alphaproteobacteria bacterium]|nr:succinylglutamate desuccinylase/aspartoacylase family protein [Alphaproteobacteria bacterium]
MSPPARLSPQDIARWRSGNAGIDYVHRRQGCRAGPHVLMTALMHGNEACGAAALDRLLASALAPSRGTLTLAFANVAAYARIDPKRPDQGRFVDEDMNRLWSKDKLDGPQQSSELARARELRPLADAADYLLDLHSMMDGTTALALSGAAAKGLRLARRVGYPATVVADAGHAGGVRLRDYDGFGAATGEKAALLVECGQHFEAHSAAVAFESALRFLAALDMLDLAAAAGHLSSRPLPRQRFIEVTHVVTIASDDFAFARPCRSLETIAEAGTLLARDGGREVRTPYDDCVPIMPARTLKPGLTAVRLGRIVASPAAA